MNEEKAPSGTRGKELEDSFLSCASQPVADALQDFIGLGDDEAAIGLLRAEKFSRADAQVLIDHIRHMLATDQAKHPKLLSTFDVALILDKAKLITDLADAYHKLEEQDAPKPVGRHKGSLLYKDTEIKAWIKIIRGSHRDGN